MQRFIIFLIITVVALASALCISVGLCINERDEKQRLIANQHALNSEMHSYRLRDSLNTASVAALTLRSRELNAHMESASAMLHDMGIKLKRLEAASVNSLESRYAITSPLRDTVYMVLSDSLPRTVVAQAASLHTPHISFDGIVAEGRFSGTVITRDTLTQVVHRVPRRFLFFRWGTRELRQEITSSNPHSQITYSRYVRVVK